MLDARYWILDVGHWMLDIRYSILGAGSFLVLVVVPVVDARYSVKKVEKSKCPKVEEQERGIHSPRAESLRCPLAL